MGPQKGTFLPLNVPVGVDDEKYPMADHGKPGSLLDIALAKGIHLEHNCGGSCACTTCHVIVKEGEENLSEMQSDEEDRLDMAEGLTIHPRLGWQAVGGGNGGRGVPEGAEGHRGREIGYRPAGKDDHGDLVAGAHVLIDHGARQRGLAAREQMDDGGHQKTRTRRPFRTRPAASSRLIRTTGWASAFQLASDGIASVSTWNGTPSALRFARNLEMSSPSMSSSVSSSSRCAPGPSSTKMTAFSPATMPRPMRIASFARCEARGSTEITTTTGELSTTESVERDETIGRVDQVGQHDQTAVGHAVRVAQGDPALLTAVGAHEQLRAALGQRADARVVERADPVVDEVQIELRAAVQRRLGQPHGGLEVFVLEPGGQEHTELLLREIHRKASVAS